MFIFLGEWQRIGNKVTPKPERGYREAIYRLKFQCGKSLKQQIVMQVTEYILLYLPEDLAILPLREGGLLWE